jgi:hypothetical protein
MDHYSSLAEESSPLTTLSFGALDIAFAAYDDDDDDVNNNDVDDNICRHGSRQQQQ